MFGATLASVVGPMSKQIAGDTNLLKTFRTVFPTFDLTSAGGFLQLFVQEAAPQSRGDKPKGEPDIVVTGSSCKPS